MGLLDDAIREHLDLKRARGTDPADIERMEREALGPVRREPTIGMTHFDAPAEHEPEHLRLEHVELEQFDELTELQELGYHDSTAPHPHPHHQDPATYEHAEPDGESLVDAEEPPQPKRRFLHRTRPPAPAEPAQPREPVDEAPRVDEPTDHGVPAEHEHLAETEEHDVLAHHDLADYDDLPGGDEPSPDVEEPPADEVQPAPEPGDDEQQPEPPHLRFERPPRRPHFSAEPPADAEPSSDAEDVEDVGQADDLADDEDVLEETPEFLQDTPEHDRLWFEQRPPRDFDFDG